MAYGKAGRPKRTGWLTPTEASRRLGISYWQLSATAAAAAEGVMPTLPLAKGKYLIKAEVVEYAKKYGTWPSGGAVSNA